MRRPVDAVRGARRARGAPTPLRGFPPIIDAGVERLILGSFPSVASLAAAQYYAHPRNQFWAILGRLLGEPLPDLPYEERTQLVLAHRVGIWDVYGACVRPGSGDAAIRQGRPNPLERLRTLAPSLCAVAFNGMAAGRFRPLFEQAGLDTRVLPSTSPAHAGRSLDQKFEAWAEWWNGAAQACFARRIGPR